MTEIHKILRFVNIQIFIIIVRETSYYPSLTGILCTIIFFMYIYRAQDSLGQLGRSLFSGADHKLVKGTINHCHLKKNKQRAGAEEYTFLLCSVKKYSIKWK